MINIAWLLWFFPLLGLLVNAVFGRYMGRKAIGWIASLVIGFAFVAAAGLAVQLNGMPAESRHVERTLWQWITVGNLQVSFAMLIDPLSVWMAMVVSGVAFLIHIYSIGYMAEDERYLRYFVFLNFFVLAMLILVMASNFLVMFIGWEGVGLASYLLIGFWFEKPSAADAGKKAFLANRVGDYGFYLGTLFLFVTFGSLSFSQIFSKAQTAPRTLITIVGLLFLLALTGKSAQIPLYVWLPDAMEGPTPVSALIHAATMVTAGVYMVARTHSLYLLSPTAMHWVAWIGVVTAFFAATMALVQQDLKRVLAYSTISQIGYMVLGVGIGAFAAGMFHLTTHAFFKALLFLGAGSVMHAMGGELNIFKMGGLKKKMPITYWTFLIAAAALAGFPLFSGFFSKDEILSYAFTQNKWMWGLGLFTALLTAFYSFRIVFVPFWGEFRGGKKLEQHVHEAPPVMTWPLILLAVGALLGGLLGLPHASIIEHWLEPTFAGSTLPHPAGGATEWILLTISSLVALTGIGLAYYFYVLKPDLPRQLSRQYKFWYNLLYHKYYVDEMYMAVIVNPLRGLARWFAQIFDKKGIDGAVNGVAWLTDQSGEGMSRLQTGYISVYALSILLGAVLVSGFFLIY